MKQYASYEEENVAYWTQRAPGYSGVNQEELATQQRAVWSAVLHGQIAAHFGAKRPEELRVLDVGTGPGFFAILLAQLGYQVTAVDYTAAMLREARHNAAALAEKIRFLEMNAEALDFPDESFDILISRNVTWNLPHPGIWKRVWTREERINNASTPMFMIRAVKPRAGTEHQPWKRPAAAAYPAAAPL